MNRSRIQDQIRHGLTTELSYVKESATNDVESRCIDSIIKLSEEFLLEFYEGETCIIEWKTKPFEKNKFICLKVENISENEWILNKLRQDDRLYSIYRSRWYDRVYIVILPDRSLSGCDCEELIFHYKQLFSSDYQIPFESTGELSPLQICNYWEGENRHW